MRFSRSLDQAGKGASWLIGVGKIGEGLDQMDRGTTSSLVVDDRREIQIR